MDNSSRKLNTEAVDESDDEADGGQYYEAKASKKKEKKRQEREAQRQVSFFNFSFSSFPSNTCYWSSKVWPNTSNLVKLPLHQIHKSRITFMIQLW